MPQSLVIQILAPNCHSSKFEMNSLLSGDLDLLLSLTAGDKWDRRYESQLSRRLTHSIIHSFKQSGSQLLHPSIDTYAPSQSLIRIIKAIKHSLKRPPTEWSMSMAVLLLSRALVHMIKGMCVGVGMYVTEWWLVTRVHALLRPVNRA
jgi:hypothetical protein